MEQPPAKTGVGRKVDDLGRIVLPAEIRRSFDIREGDVLEVNVDQDKILLSKRRDHCTFCGTTDSLRTYREQVLCSLCITEIKRL